MGVATLLNAVSANTTGPVAALGTPYGNLTLAVSTTGSVSAFSVQLYGSEDSVNWASIGSAVTSTTAGESVGSGVLFQYFYATLSGYSGTGTVTAVLAYSLEPSASGGGGPPTGAAGGALTGTYPNPGLATVTVPEGGTGDTSLTAYAPLAGGTTTTGAVQSASTGLSTSGNVFTSNGSSSLPSFQALPAASASASGIIEISNSAATAAQAAGAAGIAGTTGKAADGGHSHPTTLLATHQWAPATFSHYTSSSTTLAAMDTTNMTISFTAPSSGNVLVRLTAAAAINTSTSAAVLWGLLDHTSGNMYGVLLEVSAQISPVCTSCVQILTGLSGAYQMDWALATDNTSDAANTYAGGTTSKTWSAFSCPAVMEVWAV